ncbi:MAG: PAS domain-containing sensor histidine kinase [Armatimonadetes bacterium JP3_11]|jgi:two-component system phosphate regulon sensor histidine kinase PhoR|nr:MAG: PAS domain-containing sensor histidine kinase [Armatimonadetes bacterium JP3_11]RMH10334.1 MAG: PAS domain-containing sensor histidine kinase [Armatimonadota bacterium]
MSFRWLPASLLLSAALLLLTALPVMPSAWREALIAAALGSILLAYYLAHIIYLRCNALRQQILQLNEQRESLELELTRQQRRRLALIDGLPIPLLICDEDAMLRHTNRVALEWFGFRHMTGKSLLALTFSYDLYLLLLKAARRQSTVSAEITLSFPKERYTEATIWYLGEADSRHLFAIALIDKSELLRLEQVRRDFVANVSHEFRTPLASIRSLSETIHDDPDMPLETRQRFLNLIIQEADRLTRIAEDLLTLSRAESLQPVKEPFELTPLIQQAVQEMTTEAQRHQVQVLTDLQPNLNLLANRDQILQVVLNLLSNAIRYNKPQGSVTVRTYAQNSYAVIEVADTGIGIPSEALPRIFERFYRVDKTRSRERGGTGLGLAIVKHIVESHGGAVEVESEYRVGSVFRVKLPLYQETEQNPANPQR